LCTETTLPCAQRASGARLIRVNADSFAGADDGAVAEIAVADVTRAALGMAPLGSLSSLRFPVAVLREALAANATPAARGGRKHRSWAWVEEWVPDYERLAREVCTDALFHFDQDWVVEHNLAREPRTP